MDGPAEDQFDEQGLRLRYLTWGSLEPGMQTLPLCRSRSVARTPLPALAGGQSARAASLGFGAGGLRSCGRRAPFPRADRRSRRGALRSAVQRRPGQPRTWNATSAAVPSPSAAECPCRRWPEGKRKGRAVPALALVPCARVGGARLCPGPTAEAGPGRSAARFRGDRGFVGSGFAVGPGRHGNRPRRAARRQQATSNPLRDASRPRPRRGATGKGGKSRPPARRRGHAQPSSGGEVITRKTRSNKARVGDRVLDARRQEDHVVAADDPALALDLHEALAVEHVIDLLLHLMPVWRHVSLRLVAGDPVIEPARAVDLGPHQHLGTGAAVVRGRLLPRHLGDVRDRRARRLAHGIRPPCSRRCASMVAASPALMSKRGT